MSKTINTTAATTIFSNYGADAVNAELKSRGAATSKDVQVGAAMLAMGVRSLDEFAATVVNLTEGAVTADEMEGLMRTAFPEHKIGARHGSHYLSLARNGHLNGNVECRFAPAKAARKARSKSSVNIDVKSLSDAQRKALAKAMPELADAIMAAAEEK